MDFCAGNNLENTEQYSICLLTSLRSIFSMTFPLNETVLF